MNQICLHPDKLLDLLTEIGRHRALTDQETDLIEDIVGMDSQCFRWNARLDTTLRVAASSPGGIRRFAKRHNITEGAAYAHLHRLRKREGRKTDGVKERG